MWHTVSFFYQRLSLQIKDPLLVIFLFLFRDAAPKDESNQLMQIIALFEKKKGLPNMRKSLRIMKRCWHS